MKLAKLFTHVIEDDAWNNMSSFFNSIGMDLEFPKIDKGEITHSIESVPKVSHLWGKIDFL